MSDLLALRDFDSSEFLDRVAGLFRHCQNLFRRAAELAEQTEARVAAIRLNTYQGLAEIGEALLLVQEARPGEFGDWFELHREQLGFSPSHADRCKAAARLVREHGLEKAFALSTARAAAEARQPILADTLRLTKPIEELTDGERRKWLDRLRPWAETYHALELLAPS